MKNIGFILAILFFAAVGCEKQKEATYHIKKKLIGEWIELHPCTSCSIFEFTKKDAIIQFNTLSKDRLFAHFQVISTDSIKVIRDWEIEEDKRVTFHKIIFSSDDTLEILRFMPVDYGIIGFDDVKLYKNK